MIRSRPNVPSPGLHAYADIDKVVCWIDPNFDENSESLRFSIQMKKDNPRIAFLPFKTVAQFVEWFEDAGKSLSGRMRIVIGGKKDEVSEKNVDKLLDYLDKRTSTAQLIPIMAYLSSRTSHSLIQLMLRGVSACNDISEVKLFITED